MNESSLLKSTADNIPNPKMISSAIDGSLRKAIGCYGCGTPMSSEITKAFCRRSSTLRAKLPPSLTLPLKGGGNTPARGERTDEIHPRLAERAPRHRRAACRHRQQAHHDRARGRARRGQGGAAQAVRHRLGDFRRKASERRPPA